MSVSSPRVVSARPQHTQRIFGFRNALEAMYDSWLKDPKSVHSSWSDTFSAMSSESDQFVQVLAPSPPLPPLPPFPIVLSKFKPNHVINPQQANQLSDDLPTIRHAIEQIKTVEGDFSVADTCRSGPVVSSLLVTALMTLSSS